MRTRLLAAATASLALAAAGLAVLGTATPATAATFAERWCNSGHTNTPCVVEASRNGTAMHAGEAVGIQLIPTQSQSDYQYTSFLLDDPTKVLKTTDTVSVLIDLGGLEPEYTEGYASRPDVDRINDRDGTYKVRYTGRPVLLTTGCTDTYPNYCTDTAESQRVVFEAEIQKLTTNHELEGFDRSQSADTVDGIFLVERRGGDYLESSWDNSRLLTDGVTPAKAEARFRIPYQMLIDDFKIPSPSTMVASSLVGTVNGSPATYAFSQDPKGGAVFVDISGVTFPVGNSPKLAKASATASKPRVVRVKRGVITPTAPVLTKASRISPTKAKVTFKKAKARGARLTGYQARCQASGHKTLTAKGGSPRAVVKGLKAGRAYKCSVRGLSKAGPGRWSTRTKV